MFSSLLYRKLTCSCTTDLGPTRTNTGAVPHHSVLWSLIGFPDPVCPVIVLIKAGLLRCNKTGNARTLQVVNVNLNALFWCVKAH